MSDIENTTPPLSWYDLGNETDEHFTMAELNRRATATTAIRRIVATVMDDNYVGDQFTVAQEMVSLQSHFERFTTAHDALVSVAVADELNAHTGLYDVIETLYNGAMARLRRMEATSTRDNDGSERSLHTTRSVVSPNEVKLDPLKVPNFDGTLGNWLAFKDAFETLVHDHDYPEPYKLSKLHGAVQGDAVALVGGLYSGGYAEVWEALKKRYDNPKQLADIHVSRLLYLNTATQETGDVVPIIGNRRFGACIAARAAGDEITSGALGCICRIFGKFKVTTGYSTGLGNDHHHGNTYIGHIAHIPRNACTQHW